MNFLVILAVLATLILSFWFFDRFQITDRFITILGAVFGMFSLLSRFNEDEQDRVVKSTLVVMVMLLLIFLTVSLVGLLRQPDFQYPFNVKAEVTQKFKDNHNGIDFALPVGTALHPIREGEVVQVEGCPNCDSVQETITNCQGRQDVYDDPRWNHGYGRAVLIRHDLSVDDNDYLYSFYAHLNSISVVEGDKVNLETILGLSGNSGCSTGSHLHFELRSGNVLDVQGVWLEQTLLDPAKTLRW